MSNNWVGIFSFVVNYLIYSPRLPILTRYVYAVVDCRTSKVLSCYFSCFLLIPTALPKLWKNSNSFVHCVVPHQSNISELENFYLTQKEIKLLLLRREHYDFSCPYIYGYYDFSLRWAINMKTRPTSSSSSLSAQTGSTFLVSLLTRVKKAPEVTSWSINW